MAAVTKEIKEGKIVTQHQEFAAPVTEVKKTEVVRAAPDIPKL